MYDIWKKDVDRAVFDYTKAIELSPPLSPFSTTSGLFEWSDVIALYRSRARALSKRGDLDGAIADYTKLIEVDPKDGLHYIDRGHLYEKKGDKVGAIANYRRLLEVSPSSGDYARKALARLGFSP